MQKIDIVYLWVDGSDQKWAAQKNKWMQKILGKKQNNVADAKASATNARWRDNGEFRYSLRSVAECAPWVNHIYIITGFGQVPSWLNTHHPKITIVPHEDIIPADALPTFNSTTIEMCIPNIKNLSEHFLIMNDDVFFNRPIMPNFFYDARGRARVRYGRHRRTHRDIDQWMHHCDSYIHSLILSAQFISDIFGRHLYNPRPSHGIDPYTKSTWIECMSHPLIRSHVDWQIRNKFRTHSDIQRWIVNLYDRVHNRAIFIRSRAAKGTRHPFFDRIYNAIHWYSTRRSPVCITNAVMARHAIKRAPIFCINDDDANTPEIMHGNAAFLAARFPNKCPFEKQ